MRESHIRHLKLSSRAQLLLLELTPHQQRLQQSWRHFHYKATVLYVCWCLPPLVLTNDVFDPCGQILHMHTFPSAQCTHSEKTTLQFSSQPFTTSSKASHGSTGNFNDPWEQNILVSLWTMSLGHYAKASMD